MKQECEDARVGVLVVYLFSLYIDRYSATMIEHLCALQWLTPGDYLYFSRGLFALSWRLSVFPWGLSVFFLGIICISSLGLSAFLGRLGILPSLDELIGFLVKYK
jgi:hypothetical protein